MLVAFYSKGQQAGKDTAARFCEEWCSDHGWTYERRAFADQMKILAALALGHSAAEEGDYETAIKVMDELKLDGYVAWSRSRTVVPVGQAVYPVTDGRDFIINLSEGAKKLWGKDFWIHLALPEEQDYTRTGHLIAITDLRFPLEADRVHYLGGRVAEVVNPRAVNAGGRSEEGIDPKLIDLRLINDKTLKAYREVVRGFMGYVTGPHKEVMPD